MKYWLYKTNICRWNICRSNIKLSSNLNIMSKKGGLYLYAEHWESQLGVGNVCEAIGVVVWFEINPYYVNQIHMGMISQLNHKTYSLLQPSCKLCISVNCFIPLLLMLTAYTVSKLLRVICLKSKRDNKKQNKAFKKNLNHMGKIIRSLGLICGTSHLK